MSVYSVETLGDKKKTGWWVVGHCGAVNCGHGQTLDVDLLIARFYRDNKVIGETKIAASLR